MKYAKAEHRIDACHCAMSSSLDGCTVSINIVMKFEASVHICIRQIIPKIILKTTFSQ